MAKGDRKLITLFGKSIGQQAMNYDTKQPVPGSYRHTFNGTSWKCGSLTLSGAILLVEDEYEGNVFYRMEGQIDSAAQVAAITALKQSLEGIDLSAF
jgi:hypothetical protein